MAMNDEETVALIVGGHTFGKCHGAAGAEHVGPEPEGCPVEAQGIGWTNTFGTGKGADTITSGLEGAWTNDADEVGQRVPRQPVRLRVGADDEPRRCEAVDAQEPPRPRARCPTRTTRRSGTRPMMLTTDLALRIDPIYAPIAKRFHENPDQLADAFAKAWYKLLHRDMGPRLALPRPVGPRAAAVAGPGPGGRPRADRRRRHRRAQGQDPRVGAVDLPARLHRVGGGGELPRHRQARRRERRADPPRAAEGLGGQRPGRAGRRCCRPSSRSSRTSTARSPAARGSRSPT